MAKRGRRKKGDSVEPKTGVYYGEPQEKAVLHYVRLSGNTYLESKEREVIFNNVLKYPLNKMIESIIRRYKLYLKKESYEDSHSDTFSFLMTKLDKFDPEAHYKSYSYYGTIIKNYMLGKILKEDKEMKQNSSYEDLYPYIEENDRYSYSIEKPEGSYDDFIKELHTKIEYKIHNEDLSENEVKVAYAIVDILKNWESIFGLNQENMVLSDGTLNQDGTTLNHKGTDKFNKNKILSHIRDYTLLNTKDIRVSMKKFKELYGASKLFRLDQGLL
jgi:hypothetical protein